MKTKSKEHIITEIIQKMSTSGKYISGDLFFTLAFCEEDVLMKVYNNI